MFLVPALGAGTSDALVLYFQSPKNNTDVDYGGGFWGWMNVNKTGYLSFLAIIRLVMLCIPLSYRRYTGTRVKYAVLYYIFHGVCALNVALHMLAIPISTNGGEEEEGMFMVDKYDNYSNYNNNEDKDMTMLRQLSSTLQSLKHSSNYKQLWIVLSLTLLSISLHVLILLHLHSSAPNTDSSLLDPSKRRKRGRNRRLMAYYAYNTYRRHSISSQQLLLRQNDIDTDKNNREEEEIDDQDVPLLHSYEEQNNHHHPTAQEQSSTPTTLHHDYPFHDSMNSFTAEEENHTFVPKITTNASSLQRNGITTSSTSVGNGGGGAMVNFNKRFVEMKQCLPEDFDDFMSEVQTRLLTAQEQWSTRLNEFSLRIQPNQNNNNNNNTYNEANIPPPPLPFRSSPRNNIETIIPTSPTITTTPTPHHHHHHNRFLQTNLSPFRVLLQLFAYEEVLSNHRLDKVWSVDNGTALTFYVPQLLSFLLHGAFWNTIQLENWILDKCTKNVHFAHKCFWFLRSWCLGTGSHVVVKEEEEESMIVSVASDGNLLRFAKEEYAASGSGGSNGNYSASVVVKFGSESNLLLKQQQQLHQTSPYQDYYYNRPQLQSTPPLPPTQHDYSYGQYQDPAIHSERTTSSSNNKSSQRLCKFPQEEHSLIEALLFRVMECGEIPAKLLYYDENAVVNAATNAASASDYHNHVSVVTTSEDRGNLEGEDDTTEEEYDDDDDEDADFKPLLKSKNTKTTAPKHPQEEKTFIPVNPANGYPSVKHLNAVTAKRTFGFLPLPTATSVTTTTTNPYLEKEDKEEKKLNHGEEEGISSTATTATTTPDFLSCPHPTLPNSSPSPLPLPSSSSSHPFNSQQQENHFLSTPRFLDALTSIADDLMLVPRENRTVELRKKLQSLEIDFLPSNSIYVPVSSNHYHRVWRIVSDESIALSTKERVPCIVTLEVVDYDAPSASVVASSVATANHGNNNSGGVGGAASLDVKNLVASPLSTTSAASPSNYHQHHHHHHHNNNSRSTEPNTPQNQQQQPQPQTQASSFTTESEILNKWYKGSRHAQRHNTILDKVTTYTQQKLKRLEEFSKRQRSGEMMIGGNFTDKLGHFMTRSGGTGSGGSGTGSGNRNKDLELGEHEGVIVVDKKERYEEDNDNDVDAVVEGEEEKKKDKDDLESGFLSMENQDDNDHDFLSGLPPPPLTGKNDKNNTSYSNNDAASKAHGTTETTTTTPTTATLEIDVTDPCPSTPVSSKQQQQQQQQRGEKTKDNNNQRQQKRPPSPASAMGQWSSPTPPSSKLRIHHHYSKSYLRKRSTDKKTNHEIKGQVMMTTRTSSVSEEGSRAASAAAGGGGGNKLHYGSTYHQDIGGGIVLMNDELIVPTLKTMERIEYDEEEEEKQVEVDVECPKKDVVAASTTATSSSQRPPLVVFKEDWKTKEERLRLKSAFGRHPGWRLLPLLVKSNDDLRQEQLASQLIKRMAIILAKGKVPVWLYPYEIISLTDRGGIMEAIADTISIDSLKRNDPEYTNLKSFFLRHFGPSGSDEHADAKANFVESLAAYSMVCFLLQIKDRHNGNILLDNRGHLIHIDFGFFFLSSPGKNSGFESAPFKLTREFVDLMDGPESRTFAKFRDLCYKTFLELRKHCYEITLTVEMLMEGNEDLACFLGRPEDAVRELKERFRLDLNDRACLEYVNSLVNESLENWRTRWYDRYQRFCVGVL